VLSVWAQLDWWLEQPHGNEHALMVGGPRAAASSGQAHQASLLIPGADKEKLVKAYGMR
jgi:hypothetical protein